MRHIACYQPRYIRTCRLASLFTASPSRRSSTGGMPLPLPLPADDALRAPPPPYRLAARYALLGSIVGLNVASGSSAAFAASWRSLGDGDPGSGRPSTPVGRLLGLDGAPCG